MKKFLSTIALVLAISSVSMAKSSKKVHRMKSQVKVTFMCDGNGTLVGAISSGGTHFGNTGPGTCVCGGRLSPE